jgi:hypothetical protein
LDASSGAEAVQPTKSQKENSVWGPQGISPETPGVARIKIARSTLAPHLGMTLYASRAEQENKSILRLNGPGCPLCEIFLH